MRNFLGWALLVYVAVCGVCGLLMVGIFFYDWGIWRFLKVANDSAGQLLTFGVAAVALIYAIREYFVRNSPQISLFFESFTVDAKYDLSIKARNVNTFPVNVFIDVIRLNGKVVTPKIQNVVLIRDGIENLHVVTGHFLAGETLPEIELVCAIESAAPPYHRAKLVFAAVLQPSMTQRTASADVSEFRLTPLPRIRW